MRVGAILLFSAMFMAACGDDTGGTGGAGGSASSTGGGTTQTGGAAASGGAGGTAPSTPCEAICAFDDELEAALACGYVGTSCIADCEAAFAATPASCQDEAIAYNDCLMAQSTADFTCTAGVFSLTTAACDAELTALMGCQ